MRRTPRRNGSPVLERPAVPPPAKAEPVEHAVIRYPQEGDVVDYPYYTIQVDAPSAAEVEISIDHGEWQPCREALGLWWYDWSGFNASRHEAVARVRTLSGLVLTTPVRAFEVKLPY